MVNNSKYYCKKLFNIAIKIGLNLYIVLYKLKPFNVAVTARILSIKNMQNLF